jgi:hypothetical protein
MNKVELITDLKSNGKPSKEQIKEQIESYNEIALNQHIILAKPIPQFRDTADAMGLNPLDKKKYELKTYGQMIVIAKAEDVTLVELGQAVRVRMFSPFPEGVVVPCTIPNHELVVAKQYDLITVEK